MQCNTLKCTVNGLETKAKEDEKYIEKLKLENEDLRKINQDLQFRLPDDSEEPCSPGVDMETLEDALEEEDPFGKQCSGVDKNIRCSTGRKSPKEA